MDSDNSNEDKEKQISSDTTQETSNKKSFIARHSKAIVAYTALGSLITTFALAIFAFCSLTEVQKQRDLAFKQFVVANAPSVRVYVTEHFKFSDERGWMIWRAVNTGGPVHDVEYKTIILGCKSDKKELDLTKIVIRTTKWHRLNRGEISNVDIEVADAKTLEWLKQAVNSSDTCLFVYVRAKYTIPLELSLIGRPEEDETFRLSIWDPVVSRFEHVRPELQKKILSLIKKREYLTVEEKG